MLIVGKSTCKMDADGRCGGKTYMAEMPLFVCICLSTGDGIYHYHTCHIVKRCMRSCLSTGTIPSRLFHNKNILKGEGTSFLVHQKNTLNI